MDDAIGSYLKSGDTSRYSDVILRSRDAGAHKVLVDYLLMVRKKVKEPKVGPLSAPCAAGQTRASTGRASRAAAAAVRHASTLAARSAAQSAAGRAGRWRRPAEALWQRACTPQPPSVCRWTRSWCTRTPRRATWPPWKSSSAAPTRPTWARRALPPSAAAPCLPGAPSPPACPQALLGAPEGHPRARDVAAPVPSGTCTTGPGPACACARAPDAASRAGGRVVLRGGAVRGGARHLQAHPQLGQPGQHACAPAPVPGRRGRRAQGQLPQDLEGGAPPTCRAVPAAGGLASPAARGCARRCSGTRGRWGNSVQSAAGQGAGWLAHSGGPLPRGPHARRCATHAWRRTSSGWPSCAG